MRFFRVCVYTLAIVTSPVLAQNRVLRLDGDGDYVRLPSHIFDDQQTVTESR